jgi:hypothetical protein
VLAWHGRGIPGCNFGQAIKIGLDETGEERILTRSFRFPNPFSVGIVGLNHAQQYTSLEGDRRFPTDGKKHKHPFQEAASGRTHLEHDAKPSFDEFLILNFRATNSEPFPFEWVDQAATLADYGAVLARIAQKYDSRF